MAEALKNVYSRNFLLSFASICEKHIPFFSTDAFLQHVFIAKWKDYELKQRILHLTHVLHVFLPHTYSEAVHYLILISLDIRKTAISEANYEYLFMTDYVAEFGMSQFETSMYAIEHLTQLASAEFAIRPFIVQYTQKTMEQMEKWASHQSSAVRRLSCEGCRPRLPWSFALVNFKKDPSLIIPILEKLKDDESLFVRKSVANTLNDISKDNPDIAFSLARKWIGKNNSVNWIVKRGMRTLLKQGNANVMRLFGFMAVDTRAFSCTLRSKSLCIGQVLIADISFTLEIEALIRLEYALGYCTASNKISEKIFQISERNYAKGRYAIEVKRELKPMSTRKLYLGMHSFTLIVNGNRLNTIHFDLL